MKAFALVALAAAVALVGCGEKHEKVHAVDKVAEAQAAAMEKKPQDQERIFDDHGQKPFAEPKPVVKEEAAEAPKAEATEAVAEQAAPAADAAEMPAEEAK